MFLLAKVIDHVGDENYQDEEDESNNGRDAELEDKSVDASPK